MAGVGLMALALLLIAATAVLPGFARKFQLELKASEPFKPNWPSVCRGASWPLGQSRLSCARERLLATFVGAIWRRPHQNK